MSNADRIKRIISRHPDIGVVPSALNNDTRFGDHLGADDLVLLDLTYELEEEFAIVLDDRDQFSTVGELIALIEQKLEDKLPRTAVA